MLKYYPILTTKFGLEASLLISALEHMKTDKETIFWEDILNDIDFPENETMLSKNEILIDKTGLTAYQIRKGLKVLEAEKIVSVEYHGAPAIRFIKFHKNNLAGVQTA